MRKNADALTASNFILVTSALVLASIIVASLSTLDMPDSGGLARDSFGTHGDGFRGVFELLGELGAPAERDGSPPSAQRPRDATICMLAPDDRLAATNPRYLRQLMDWVNGGGRLVVSPRRSWEEEFDGAAEQAADLKGPTGALEALGIQDKIHIKRHIMTGSTRDASSSGDKGYLPKWLNDSLSQEPVPAGIVKVRAAGSLSNDVFTVSELMAPGHEIALIEAAADQIAGSVALQDSEGTTGFLAVSLQHGAGEVIVISDPELLANRFLAHADNSVLAVLALSPEGERVVFDEFYHGLGVRGNPLYLLTRPGFAAIVAALLGVIAIWAWRGARFLGPPLPDDDRSRRDIGEYIGAMAQFFRRAPDRDAFLLRETRDGVLRELCRQLSLPLETPDAGAVVEAYSRRRPQRAAKLRSALAEADTASTSRNFTNSYLLMQRLAHCL